MSHNKNYGSYFKKDEPKEEASVSYEQKREEVQEPVEETPSEEEKVEEVQPIAPPKHTKIFATVTGGKACKMRFKPDKKAQVINIIPLHAKVTILDEAGEWWKVRYKEITGYMMSQFLKKE